MTVKRMLYGAMMALLLAGCGDDGGSGPGGGSGDAVHGQELSYEDCTGEQVLVLNDYEEGGTIEKGCYQVRWTAYSINGELTIEPGTVLKFDRGEKMTFSNTGSLNAVGTPDEPIVFTGMEKTPGFWKEITFKNGSTGNRLEHVIVEYGGDDVGSAKWLFSLIGVGSGVELTLRNSILRHSETWGLRLEKDGIDLSGLDGVLIEDNPEGALYTKTEYVPAIGTNNIIRGHDDDCITTMIDVPTDQRWPAQLVPYCVRSLRVSSHLTLAPGATLALSGTLDIQNSGQLTAVGTADAPITLTGQTSEPGAWAGLEIGSTAPNRIEHAVIEHAGGFSYTSVPNEIFASIFLGQPSRSTSDPEPDPGHLSLVDTTIRHSDGDGIYVHTGELSECASVAFEDIAGSNLAGEGGSCE